MKIDHISKLHILYRYQLIRRRFHGLLTSAKISGIRAKYGISQSDFVFFLDGGKTITRYESHQMQDKAHDTILKKIDQNPYLRKVKLMKPICGESANMTQRQQPSFNRVF